MPDAARNEESFSRLEFEEHGLGLREQGEFLVVRLFQVRDLRRVVLIGADVNERRLVRGEYREFLGAVNLADKRMGVITVEMQERELSALASDVKFLAAVMKPRAQ